MSTAGKATKTLAKKLCEKKISRKLQPKIEQAEDKSDFFKEIKNHEKSNKNTKIGEQTVPIKQENVEKIVDTKKSKLFKNNNTNPVNKGSNLKRSSRNDNDFTPSILSSENPNKIKTPIKESKEEPSTSKKMKEEFEGEKWQPPNWKIMLENIRNMRSSDKAPVDTMGCHKCADENADEKTQRFHKLIALMLSSQTKDETTYHAMLRLREQNLTPEVICNMKVNVLENILHPVCFYKNKAKYMQQTSKILVEKYSSDIPNNVKELVALPGVGPKMAHICMAKAWDKVTGIGVDVHVHRISNRIGWLPKSTKEPEQTRVALETWLPQHLWSEVNHLLVGFGQTICTPVKPKCSECLNFKICPSAVKISKKS